MITKRELYHKFMDKLLTDGDIEEYATYIRFELEFLLRPRKLVEQVFNDIVYTRGLLYHHKNSSKN